MFDCIVVYKKVEVTVRGAFTFFVFKEELTTVPVKLPSPGLTMAIVQAPGPDQSWLFYFIPPFYTFVKEADISFISASLYGNCCPDGNLDTSLIRMQAFGPMFLTNY